MKTPTSPSSFSSPHEQSPTPSKSANEIMRDLQADFDNDSELLQCIAATLSISTLEMLAGVAKVARSDQDFLDSFDFVAELDEAISYDLHHGPDDELSY
ncbi:hypothetical protein [Desulfurispira natronophila]|uniref:Uncharacterized protein n=1 Tax=Desulfurispira natronophila TaxID=682562 RepID=A0A7W8DHN4_9BACT|nr:hypothetical protein [Desulfurispira natronophila]MBB5022634.1 hypothetical protein [Desulfurispira natronophila]